jgi:hypothetical protein
MAWESKDLEGLLIRKIKLTGDAAWHPNQPFKNNAHGESDPEDHDDYEADHMHSEKKLVV